MKVNMIRSPSDDDWLLARNDGLFTNRKMSEKTPSLALRNRMLVSEHSPIYGLRYIWEWVDIPYWVSVHFVRHNVGITHFVSSQRNDRQDDYDRRKAPQDSFVNHRCIANPMSIINISTKRLCLVSSKETRDAWTMFLTELGKVSPEIEKLCVKPCIRRNGICPEVFSRCRYNETKIFSEEVKEYRKSFLK